MKSLSLFLTFDFFPFGQRLHSYVNEAFGAVLNHPVCLLTSALRLNRFQVSSSVLFVFELSLIFCVCVVVACGVCVCVCECVCVCVCLCLCASLFTLYCIKTFCLFCDV